MAKLKAVYRMDLSLAFPEVISRVQSTENSVRPVSALAMTAAYLLSGNKFRGALEDLTPEEIYHEMLADSIVLGVDLERVFDWAQNLTLEPEVTLDPESYLLVPERLYGPGFRLHDYQREVAAWHAARYGSIGAHGCGVGKTAIGSAAAIAAARIGKCAATRCFIICPLNAVGAWQKYIPDLRQTFAQVEVISCDSVHHITSLGGEEGGAVIFDEVHKQKNYAAGRSSNAHKVRPKFEWALGLTGSLLHTGCEGVMSILDLACPGLSRFTDKWAFGYTFDAVVTKLIKGVGQRRTLAIPGKTNQEMFERYLSRGVRSLSFESDEVSACIQVPSQQLTLEDTWEIPTWVRDLRDTFVQQKMDEAEQSGCGDMFTADDALKSCPYLWGPEEQWQLYSGALALAMMNENHEFAVEYMLDIFDRGIPRFEADLIPDDRADDYLLPEVKDLIDRYRDMVPELEAVEFPFVPEELTARMGEFGHKLLELDPKNRFWKRLVRYLGLPSFPALFWELRTDGRFARIVERVTEDQGGLKRVTYRFRYASGHDRKHPGIGPKLTWVLDWLDANPGEPLIIGTARRRTLSVLLGALEKRDLRVGVIDGSVSKKVRPRLEQAFQEGDLDVMLLQQVAGSESITLTRANISVTVEHDLAPHVYTQFRGRTRRVGQDRECIHYDLAFNSVQVDRVQALRRGEEFDTETRKAIEASIKYDTVG